MDILLLVGLGVGGVMAWDWYQARKAQQEYEEKLKRAISKVILASWKAGFAAMLGLWLAAGFGTRIRSPRIQEAHYAFMRWWLGILNRAASKPPVSLCLSAI